MNTQFWLIQAFNGISYGALLFLVGSGLSLIFGVMRIVNLSHGSFFLFGRLCRAVGDLDHGLLGAVASSCGALDRGGGLVDGTDFPAAPGIRSIAAGAAH